mmetsp:Transcript_325/g.1070  ORF Transcript_325/g.1070 Transcript_325/m.1070 type:complete len:219 (+) Transcript_325:175-831(+)
MNPIIRFVAATYARADATTMSVSAPDAVNVRASISPLLFAFIATLSIGRTRTRVSARDSIPSTTALTLYSTSSTLPAATMPSMALYVASTGPEPTSDRTRLIPSGPHIFTVAVGRPIVPHTTWTSSSFHDADLSTSPANWLPSHVTSAMISSSSTPPVFCSATSLNRLNISSSASPSSGYPNCLSFDDSACLPECLPMTTPTESSPRKYPIVSGAMIS